MKWHTFLLTFFNFVHRHVDDLYYVTKLLFFKTNFIDQRR